MRVLVACEFSGRVREAFRARGHDAISCDLVPSLDHSPHHAQHDVLDMLHDGWDLMIAFPPCTYLCRSGMHWNWKRPERQVLTEEAVEFVKKLYNAPIPKIAIENPIGVLSTRIRKPDQKIQPYMFGDDAKKTTCLWLKDLPLLVPTKMVAPRIVNGVERWSNQYDKGTDKFGPSRRRPELRSKTYIGIAEAMAEQWG